MYSCGEGFVSSLCSLVLQFVDAITMGLASIMCTQRSKLGEYTQQVNLKERGSARNVGKEPVSVQDCKIFFHIAAIATATEGVVSKLSELPAWPTRTHSGPTWYGKEAPGPGGFKTSSIEIFHRCGTSSFFLGIVFFTFFEQVEVASSFIFLLTFSEGEVGQVGEAAELFGLGGCSSSIVSDKVWAGQPWLHIQTQSHEQLFSPRDLHQLTV